LNRFRAIMNKRKEMLEGRIWTKRNGPCVYNCYPIYDWKTEDIWTGNAKYEWEYNGLYDVFYKAGVPVHKMRSGVLLGLLPKMASSHLNSTDLALLVNLTTSQPITNRECDPCQ